MFISVLISLLFIQEGIAQETSYKDSVIALLNETRRGTKVYNEHDKGAKRKYFYHKKTKKIVGIFISPYKSGAAFQYEFINNELVMIRLYLPLSALPPTSRGEKNYGVYFFKNNVFVDKDELNFPQIDIEQFKVQGLELFKRAVQFLEKKGIK